MTFAFDLFETLLATESETFEIVEDTAQGLSWLVRDTQTDDTFRLTLCFDLVAGRAWLSNGWCRVGGMAQLATAGMS